MKIRKAKLQPEHAALTAPPAHTARMRLLVGGAVFWGLVAVWPLVFFPGSPWARNEMFYLGALQGFLPAVLVFIGLQLAARNAKAKRSEAAWVVSAIFGAAVFTVAAGALFIVWSDFTATQWVMHGFDFPPLGCGRYAQCAPDPQRTALNAGRIAQGIVGLLALSRLARTFARWRGTAEDCARG